MTIDSPRPVRAGDELDVARLAAYLGGAVPGWEGVRAQELAVAQFGGGFSNLTYLVSAGARELVLRRPPHGDRRGNAHDVGREHRLLAALHPAYGRVPRPLARCDDPTVLGAPFFCMERVRGAILRGRPGDPMPGAPTLAVLADAFVAELAALHAVDWRAAGLGGWGNAGGYVPRQVAGWMRRWGAAGGDASDEWIAVIDWLAEHLPPIPDDELARATLVHNDFKYDNLVLDPDALARGEPVVRAVLDWEMATVGEPLMDLGTSLAYWLGPRDPPELRALGLGLTAAPGSPSRAELVAMYARTTGRDVSGALFCYVFGLFKLAGVAQQLYARHAAGHSRDPRFAGLDRVVAALGRMASRAAAEGTLDPA